MADYWTKRQKRLLESMEKDERKLNQRLEKIYKRHESEIQQEIAAYYAQYGKESVIEYRVLLQGLSEADRTMLYERAEAFMEKHPQYADLMPIRESIYRLNRLEGMQVSMWIHLAEIGAIQEDELREHLAHCATEAGNLAAEALSHGPGFLDVNSAVIKATLDSKWVDGQDFSERIWGNQRKLAGYLADDFAKGVARGESYDRLCKALLQRFDKVERRDAERLIYTEGTFVFNESQAQVFQQDFETYSISTVGDAKVCEACRLVAEQSEVKPFRFDERETGVNFPPFHPWCRCSHVPAVDDWDQWIEDYVARNRDESAGDILAESGALNDKNDPGSIRRDAHAERYYEQVRNRDRDIEVRAVSEHSGFSTEIVDAVYQHVFIDKHDLTTGYKRFEPDYEMAQSWQRLRLGKDIQKHDKLLIMHEYEEILLMADGLSYQEAHDKVCSMGYDYQKALAEWLSGKGE